jgi:hypothetical protein
MTQQNMNADMMNIMDDIRLEQIDQLDKAIDLWNRHKGLNKAGDAMSDKGYELSTHEKQAEFAKNRCNPHPDAPHGFVRNASHSDGRYVCECEYWKPDD